MTQKDGQNGGGKKMINGVWVLLVFALLFIGVIVLGLFTL